MSWYDQEPVLFSAEFEVRQSNIPGAGDGVFAKSDIPSQMLILEYEGLFKYANDTSSLDSKYGLGVGNNVTIVGTSMASKINDICLFQLVDEEGLAQLRQNIVPSHKHLSYNCEFYIQGVGEFAQAYIRSIKDIHVGDELYINYGPNYWISRLILNKFLAPDYMNFEAPLEQPEQPEQKNSKLEEDQ
jgi:SET domain-containing protein